MKMKLEKFHTCLMITTVFYLPTIWTSQEYYYKLNSSQSLSDEKLNYVLEHLVESCFTNPNKLIVLSGKTSEKLFKKLHESVLTSLIKMSIELPSMDNMFTPDRKNSITKYSEEYYFRFEHKAQGFILAANSSSNLGTQFKQLINSRWWNAAGLFIIINGYSKPENYSCGNAEQFLWIAWKNNVLSSIFLCHDDDDDTGGLIIYSYNPFNDMVPKNWTKVSQRDGRQGHPWILFRRNASDGLEDCSEIFYDKTKTLNDYKIRSNVIQLFPRIIIDNKKNGLDKYSGEEGELLKSVIRFLNASMDEIIYSFNDSVGVLYPNGTYTGMLVDQFSGEVDVGLNARYMIKMWKIGSTYPYTTSEFCYLIKSRGNIPRWMNLAFVFDLWFTLGLLTVVLLTTMVFICHSSVSKGCLNGLRLIISATLIKPPSQSPAKLFLINVFFLLLISNGAFQGRLVSLLTKPRAFENPETETDLRETGYAVFGFPYLGEFIDDSVLRSRYKPTEKWSCLKELGEDEPVICVVDCQIAQLIPYPYSKDLHIVPQRLQSFHMIFITSSDWTLLDRFNRIVQRLREAGLSEYWKKSRKQNDLFEEHSLSILSISDLAFIFWWLLFGLIFATLVFLYEIFNVWCGIKFRE